MATIVGDVTGLQQLHHPQNIPHIVEKIKTLETLQHIKNSGGGFHHPPPPPLVPRWGYEYECMSEG